MKRPGRDTSVVLIKIDGVVVGKMFVDDDGNLTSEITAPGTKAYLRELILLELIDGLSLDFEYVGESPENLIPTPRTHLYSTREH